MNNLLSYDEFLNELSNGSKIGIGLGAGLLARGVTKHIINRPINKMKQDNKSLKLKLDNDYKMAKLNKK